MANKVLFCDLIKNIGDRMLITTPEVSLYIPVHANSNILLIVRRRLHQILPRLCLPHPASPLGRPNLLPGGERGHFRPQQTLLHGNEVSRRGLRLEVWLILCHGAKTLGLPERAGIITVARNRLTSIATLRYRPQPVPERFRELERRPTSRRLYRHLETDASQERSEVFHHHRVQTS